MSDPRNRAKNAELLSLAGACIASIGLGAALAEHLGSAWLLLFIFGLAIHAAAMFYRRRLEQSGGVRQTRWERILYWSCWAIIFSLAVYLAVASVHAA